MRSTWLRLITLVRVFALAVFKRVRSADASGDGDVNGGEALIHISFLYFRSFAAECSAKTKKKLTKLVDTILDAKELVAMNREAMENTQVPPRARVCVWLLFEVAPSIARATHTDSPILFLGMQMLEKIEYLEKFFVRYLPNDEYEEVSAGLLLAVVAVAYIVAPNGPLARALYLLTPPLLPWSSAAHAARSFWRRLRIPRGQRTRLTCSGACSTCWRSTERWTVSTTRRRLATSLSI